MEFRLQISPSNTHSGLIFLRVANPSRQYDAKWFDSTKVSLTLNVNVNGEKQDVTMDLKSWSDALNGATVTDANGNSQCFGDGIADVDTRLEILAAIEAEILATYNYIPMLQDASMSLLSKQVYYVIDEYHSVIGKESDAGRD